MPSALRCTRGVPGDHLITLPLTSDTIPAGEEGVLELIREPSHHLFPAAAPPTFLSGEVSMSAEDVGLECTRDGFNTFHLESSLNNGTGE